MQFLRSSEPLLRRKQHALDVQDLKGLLKLDLKIGNFQLLSGTYTRIDQVFLLWGVITAIIFLTAQFMPIAWHIQAIAWSILTLVGTAFMGWLAWCWVRIERLSWLIYLWGSLMLSGVILTDLGIFLGWGWVLMHLCSLWLVLSALGYVGMGLGMGSRTFLLVGGFHLCGIAVLPQMLGWQFLATGVLMAGSLLLLAEVQWDMRPPIENYAFLTAEEQEFNRQQQHLRQLTS